jgi:dCMP deaminase
MLMAHMRAARVYSKLSYCKRKQVGCIIVDKDRTVSIGYNGTPSGEDNCCEDDNNITKPSVIHAEFNAIKKLQSLNQKGTGMTMFITMSPCLVCAKAIFEFGIKEIYFEEEYSKDAGIQFLRNNGCMIQQLSTD